VLEFIIWELIIYKNFNFILDKFEQVINNFFNYGLLVYNPFITQYNFNFKLGMDLNIIEIFYLELPFFFSLRLFY